jgi:predicted permease
MMAVKNVLRNPMIWEVVAGFAFSLSGLQMPAPVRRTVDLSLMWLMKLQPV